MNIYEAVNVAIEEKCGITRKSWEYDEGDLKHLIIPTNGRECCIVKMEENRKEVSRSKWWNPKAEDLNAVDWEPVKE